MFEIGATQTHPRHVDEDQLAVRQLPHQRQRQVRVGADDDGQIRVARRGRVDDLCKIGIGDRAPVPMEHVDRLDEPAPTVRMRVDDRRAAADSRDRGRNTTVRRRDPVERTDGQPLRARVVGDLAELDDPFSPAGVAERVPLAEHAAHDDDVSQLDGGLGGDGTHAAIIPRPTAM